MKSLGKTDGLGTIGLTAEPGRYLSFYLGEEIYAIEILKVREIIGVIAVTPVPEMPKSIIGVINLRGKIVPVMDVRIRFGLPTIETTEESCIIVVQHGSQLMGVLVDRVLEVDEIKSEQLDAVPFINEQESTSFLSGMAKLERSVQLLIHVEHSFFQFSNLQQLIHQQTNIEEVKEAQL